MLDLRVWIAKRISWKRTRRVNVNGEGFVSEEIAAALFKERQQLGRKMLKERARRRLAERLWHERGVAIAQSNVLINIWRERALAAEATVGVPASAPQPSSMGATQGSDAASELTDARIIDRAHRISYRFKMLDPEHGCTTYLFNEEPVRYH
jgi:hypothetical protein